MMRKLVSTLSHLLKQFYLYQDKYFITIYDTNKIGHPEKAGMKGMGGRGDVCYNSRLRSNNVHLVPTTS